MKTNFTFLKSLIIFVSSFYGMAVKADESVPTLNFNSVPVLVSGVDLQPGAQYRFNNVTSGINVLVTIVSATGGATVVMLDDNTLTKPEAFSPQIKVPAGSSGMVEFRFDFVNGGGNAKTISSFFATAMDIDGFSTLHEMDALNMGAGSVLSYQTSTLEINVAQSGNEYLATNIAGIEYTGVDTAAKQVMFTLYKNSLNSFTYKAGMTNQNSYEVTRQKGIYFKGFDYLAALPVRYRSFDAVTGNNGVSLKWITENEINNSHFEIERSVDGVNFKTIGKTAAGAAAGNGSKLYSFIDNSALLAEIRIVYYRLKQVDMDGGYAYSNIAAVRMNAATNVSLQVSPNPFAENLNVRFTAAENGTAQVELLNMNGQKVHVQQVNAGKGNNTAQVMEIGKLAPGIYVARLIVNGELAGTQKIIKN